MIFGTSSAVAARGQDVNGCSGAFSLPVIPTVDREKLTLLIALHVQFSSSFPQYWCLGEYTEVLYHIQVRSLQNK